MSRTREWTMVAVVAVSFALMGQATAQQQQEFKGQVQVKVGSHRVKLEKDKLYEVALDSSPKDQSLNLIVPFGATFVRDKTNRIEKALFVASRSEEYNIIVFSNSTISNMSADYTLKVKERVLAEKPLLEKQDKWTNNDPTYKPARDTYFKDYKIKLKAGDLVIIDLIKGGPGIDPYLYLEGPDGKVVASDDDSGGDLNARIVYAAPGDGEYRVIATTLNKIEGGDFWLKVRQAK